MPDDKTKGEPPFRGIRQKSFADAMETGMLEYEKSIAAVKRKLFAQILPSETVVDVGIGTGPNLRFLQKGTHVLGVDPNEYMWPYAMQKARENGIELRVVGGTGEKLPVDDESCDVVIITLTLCSVRDPSQAIKEVLRVLKPGGRLFFIEHVIADRSRPVFRFAQNLLNPLQAALADGCHLNRDTASILENVQGSRFRFSEVQYEKFDVGGSWNPIRPHIAGYARKEPS